MANDIIIVDEDALDEDATHERIASTSWSKVIDTYKIESLKIQVDLNKRAGAILKIPLDGKESPHFPAIKLPFGGFVIFSELLETNPHKIHQSITSSDANILDMIPDYIRIDIPDGVTDEEVLDSIVHYAENWFMLHLEAPKLFVKTEAASDPNLLAKQIVNKLYPGDGIANYAMRNNGIFLDVVVRDKVLDYQNFLDDLYEEKLRHLEKDQFKDAVSQMEYGKDYVARRRNKEKR